MKKDTQMIFDDLKDPVRRKRYAEAYGDLGIQFDIFQALIDARLKKGLTQKQLAEQVGITQPVLARIESGRTNPTLWQIIKIASILGHKIKVV